MIRRRCPGTGVKGKEEKRPASFGWPGRSVFHLEQGLAHGQLVRAAVLKGDRAEPGSVGQKRRGLQLAAKLPGGALTAVDDGDGTAEIAGDGLSDEGIVGTACLLYTSDAADE